MPNYSSAATGNVIIYLVSCTKNDLVRNECIGAGGEIMEVRV
jgi:hypothetical protein